MAIAAAPPSLYGQELGFPSLPPDAPAGTGTVQACAPSGVSANARCGIYRVPAARDSLDRSTERTIDIAFVVVEAPDSAARARDAIIFLPSGPGEEFTSRAAASLQRVPPEVRERRDILLVDVRGVGRSQGLSCDVPHPSGFASRFGAVFPLDHVAACRDSLARRARLDEYTTEASVDDLEELRRWLGYPSLNLLGTSYGTRVAQIYMRRYPQAVRTAVLNGVAPVAEPSYVHHAALLQRALERLIDECGAEPGCAAAFPSLGGQLQQLLARFEAGPVEVEVRDERVPFGRHDLAYALRGLLYARGAELPALIAAAADGDVRPLAEYYAQRTDVFSSPRGNTGHQLSVLCAEDIAPTTDEMVARATAGTFLGDYLIETYRAVCRVWPHARLPEEYWRPVRSDVPTLLLSGARDPVTPPEGGDAVAAHLPNSLHVVVPNGGHGVRGECIQRMIAYLVTTGGVDGLDRSCVEAAPRTPFRLTRD